AGSRPSGPPGARLSRGALAGRRRQQGVLGGQPAASRAAEPARGPLLERGGAEDTRLALRVEDGAERLLEVVELDLERPQLVGPPPFSHATASRSATATCSISPSGSCRKRSPSSRKSDGSPVVRKR